MRYCRKLNKLRKKILAIICLLHGCCAWSPKIVILSVTLSMFVDFLGRGQKYVHNCMITTVPKAKRINKREKLSL